MSELPTDPREILPYTLQKIDEFWAHRTRQTLELCQAQRDLNAQWMQAIQKPVELQLEQVRAELKSLRQRPFPNSNNQEE